MSQNREPCIDCGMMLRPGFMGRHEGSKNCRERQALNEGPGSKEI